MKYKTILADPPWQYDARKWHAGNTWKKDGSADCHYSTMPLEEIKKLSLIKQTREKDCILFLWATIPMLPEAIEVLNSWGFKYKTALIWIKIRTLPMGYWWRVNTEVCLVGKRGNIKAFRQNLPNLFFAPVVKHSKKPERFFQMIDPIIPRPAIELFAREKREGWDSWGLEIKD